MSFSRAIAQPVVGRSTFFYLLRSRVPALMVPLHSSLLAFINTPWKKMGRSHFELKNTSMKEKDQPLA